MVLDESSQPPSSEANSGPVGPAAGEHRCCPVWQGEQDAGFVALAAWDADDALAGDPHDVRVDVDGGLGLVVFGHVVAAGGEHFADADPGGEHCFGDPLGEALRAQLHGHGHPVVAVGADAVADLIEPSGAPSRQEVDRVGRR